MKCKTYRYKTKNFKMFGYVYVDIINTCFIICASTSTLKYTSVGKVSKIILT